MTVFFTTPHLLFPSFRFSNMKIMPTPDPLYLLFLLHEPHFSSSTVAHCHASGLCSQRDTCSDHFIHSSLSPHFTFIFSIAVTTQVLLFSLLAYFLSVMKVSSQRSRTPPIFAATSPMPRMVLDKYEVFVVSVTLIGSNICNYYYYRYFIDEKTETQRS